VRRRWCEGASQTRDNRVARLAQILREIKEPLAENDNPKSTETGLAGSLRFRQWDAKRWVDDVSIQLLYL
jgi:hypothetical protein